MNGLLGSSVLEVAIGIAFVYLLLAVFCTTVNEWIAGLLKTRGRLLKQGILQLLAPDGTGGSTAAGNTVAALFYEHPLVKSLMRDGAHPSYLPARTFAKAIMDIATPNHPGSISFADLETGIKTDLPDGSVKKALLAAIEATDKTIDGAQRAIEAWYDDAMDRVSGWYKRKTQLWTVIIAAAIAIGTNADTLHIARRLWLEPTLRSAFVEGAKTPPKPSVSVTYPNADNPAEPVVASNGAGTSDADAEGMLGLVLGWKSADLQVPLLTWLQRIVGWLLTIIAVSLGAPFWFDVLNKFMNIRNAGKSPADQPRPPSKPSLPLVNP